MKYRNGIIGAIVCALCACGASKPAANEGSKATSRVPLPPLERTPRTSPVVRAKGGTVFKPDGTEFDLADAYASSNAIVVFYRGHW